MGKGTKSHFPKMTASNSRKRPHSSEDIDECLPISKRIHKLQIEPEGNSSTEEEYKNLMRSDSCTEQGSPDEVPVTPWAALSHQPGAGDLHSNHSTANNSNRVDVNTQLPQTSLATESNSVEEMDMERYSPELPEEDNPHYFRINRLLFQANSSRVIRSRSSIRLNNEQSML